MGGYEIANLTSEAKKIIKEKNIDKNHDGLINDTKDNNELAVLLSSTGKKDIHELAEKDMSVAYLLMGEAAFGAGAGMLGNYLLQGANKPIPNDAIMRHANSLIEDNKMDRNVYKQYGKMGRYITGKPMPKEMTIKDAIAKAHKFFADSVKGQRRAGKFLMGVTFGFAVLTAMTAYFARVGKKDISYVENQKETEQAKQTAPKNEWESKFRGGFGNDTNLREYTPQKGEYWTSILKAKYGVDDATAKKMTNKIKSMIYDNPTIGKQPPVMYLPEKWEFENEIYYYIEDSQPEKTTKFSNDVKTEMGKVDKYKY